VHYIKYSNFEITVLKKKGEETVKGSTFSLKQLSFPLEKDPA
jgi:hypothetical protein